MYPKKEVNGGALERCARLCPQGWTVVGRMNIENTGADHNTSLRHKYATLGDVTPKDERSSDLNATLKRFLDLKTMRIASLRSLMTPDESVA